VSRYEEQEREEQKEQLVSELELWELDDGEE